MNKKFRFFCISVTLFSFVISVVSYAVYANKKHSVCETALSLCGNVLQKETSNIEKADMIKNLLVFTDIPEETKVHLINAVFSNSDLLNIEDDMLYFEYSSSAIMALCEKINKIEISNQTFKTYKNILSRHAFLIFFNFFNLAS